MELYLRWLERYEHRSGEDSPLRLILCAAKSDEHIELLRLDKTGIHVAAYVTELPPRELLERNLHDAVRIACARLKAPERGDGKASAKRSAAKAPSLGVRGGAEWVRGRAELAWGFPIAAVAWTSARNLAQ